MKIKITVIEIVYIVVFAAITGIIFNWISGNGISLLYHTPQIDDQDNLSADQAYKLYIEGRALFIDARYPQEYENIRIKNSINIPASYSIDKIAGRLEKYKKDQMMIVYCTSTGCNYSTRVAETCRFLKYSNVFIFRGGIEEWDKKGYPLIKATE